MTKYVIEIVGRVDGLRTEYDGKYVVEYDPTIPPLLVCDPALAGAKVFDALDDALDYYYQTSPNVPTRPDGEPNRPLTAFSVAFVRCGDD